MIKDNKIRQCPKCNNDINYQSFSAKRKADEKNSICKNCRSNQIPQKFNKEQSDFFIGLMLGDGGLIWGKTCLFPRLSISRQLQDKDYVFWQYKLFKEFYGTPPKYYKTYDNRTKKYYETYSCITKSGQLFKDQYETWYPKPKYIKRVPKNLKLNPFILLVWFLDDSCITISGKHSLTIKLSTDGFSKKDTKFLANLLEKYIGEKINIYKNGKGWILKASTLAAIKIIKIIDPILPDCMKRKRTWKDYDFEYFEKNPECFGKRTAHSQETKDYMSRTFRGENSGGAKLTWDKVNAIRKYYINNKCQFVDLAKAFNVSIKTITNIINNKTWIIYSENKLIDKDLQDFIDKQILETKNNKIKLKQIKLNKLVQDNEKCRKLIKNLVENKNFTYKELAHLLEITSRSIILLSNGKNFQKKTTDKILSNLKKNIKKGQVGNRQRNRFSEGVRKEKEKKIIRAIKKNLKTNQYNQYELAEILNISKGKLQKIIKANNLQKK